MTLEIETPALLFSATSLILLAYTNRFLTIAQIVRSLKKHYDEVHTKSILLQIKNLLIIHNSKFVIYLKTSFCKLQ